MGHQIAIIGDQFMLPSMFEEAIVACCGNQNSIRSMANGWPDEPMEHGYAKVGMDGLKEYLGDPDSVCDFIGDAEILVTHLAPLSRGMLQRLPKLKMVAVSRGGPVNIDLHATKDKGVRVVNAPGRNASAVAEFTIGAILAETRLIRAGHDSLRSGQWRGDLYRADLAGKELHEMTVGVIGYGQVGTRVVPLLKAFGTKILVHDPYVVLSDQDVADGVEQVGFDEILQRSDVITLHPRVTDETKHMMNADTLFRMKPGSFLINTARGPIVDYKALHKALKSQYLGGAMLETFDVEPVVADSPFLKLPNVTLTPHIAGASVYTVTKATNMAAEEVRRYLNGEPPLNPC